MTKEEFRKVLTGAAAGTHSDLEVILQLYMPLIDSNSYLLGQLDEDLKQYLLMHIAINISKFSFWQNS